MEENKENECVNDKEFNFMYVYRQVYYIYIYNQLNDMNSNLIYLVYKFKKNYKKKKKTTTDF